MRKFFVILNIIILIILLVLDSVFYINYLSPEVKNKPKGAENFKVKWVEIIEEGKGNYNFVGFVENSNADFGARAMRFEFSADEGGFLKKKFKKSGLSYIMPGKNRHIMSGTVEIPFVPQNASLKLYDIRWGISDSDFKDAIISVKQSSYRVSSSIEKGSGMLSGTIYNKGSRDLAKVDLDLILYDKHNHILDVGELSLSDIKTSSENYFEKIWQDSVRGEVSYFDVIPNFNILDSGIFLKN